MITVAHLSPYVPCNRMRRKASVKHVVRRPVGRPVCRPVGRPVDTATRALPDFVAYAELQLVSWVLPMVVVGRSMDLHYEEIGKGLVALGVFKTCLHYILSSQ